MFRQIVKSRVKILRATLLASTLCLSACGDCGPYGMGNLPCFVGSMALGIALAPFRVVADFWDKKITQPGEQRSNWNKFQSGDFYTAVDCMRGCDGLFPDDIDYKPQVQRATDLVLTQVIKPPFPGVDGWKLPVLMNAYLKEGELLLDSDPKQAEIYLRKAAALSLDRQMTVAVESHGSPFYVRDDYDAMLIDIQANLMVLQYRGVGKRKPNPSILKDRCQAVAAWPAPWLHRNVSPNDLDTMAADGLAEACNNAYLKQFGDVSTTITSVPGIIDPISSQ